MARKPVQAFFLGRYHCVEELGGGGMAEVFRAKTYGLAGFEKEFAVKRIATDLSENLNFIKLFMAEAKLAATLNHGNIVRTFELGSDEGQYFIVMEYIQGIDLGELMDDLAGRGQSLPWELAVLVAMELCKGLEYLHEKRDPDGHAAMLVHRDLSPANVMLSYSGEVRLLDFGIAKGEATELAEKRVGLGKLSYMAPEQIRDEEPVDRRADLFSLGVLLYEMLSGRYLFRRPTLSDSARAAEAAEVPPLVHDGRPIDPVLDAIVRQLLARNPSDRLPSAGVTLDALGGVLLAKQRHVSVLDLAAFLRDQAEPTTPAAQKPPQSLASAFDSVRRGDDRPRTQVLDRPQPLVALERAAGLSSAREPYPVDDEVSLSSLGSETIDSDPFGLNRERMGEIARRELMSLAEAPLSPLPPVLLEPVASREATGFEARSLTAETSDEVTHVPTTGPAVPGLVKLLRDAAGLAPSSNLLASSNAQTTSDRQTRQAVEPAPAPAPGPAPSSSDTSGLSGPTWPARPKVGALGRAPRSELGPSGSLVIGFAEKPQSLGFESSSSKLDTGGLPTIPLLVDRPPRRSRWGAVVSVLIAGGCVAGGLYALNVYRLTRGPQVFRAAIPAAAATATPAAARHDADAVGAPALAAEVTPDVGAVAALAVTAEDAAPPSAAVARGPGEPSPDATAVAAAPAALPADGGLAGSSDGASNAATATEPVAPGSGSLRVASTPTNASLFVNGRLVGATPAQVAFEPEKPLSLVLLKDGFQVWRRRITKVPSNRRLDATLGTALTVPSGGPAGFVQLECPPRTIRLYIDGIDSGLPCTSERLSLRPGRHTLEIFDPSANSRARYSLRIRPRRSSALTIR